MEQNDYESNINNENNEKKNMQMQVEKWLKLDNRKKELANEVKDIKGQQKSIEASIIQYMQHNNIEIVNFKQENGGKTRLSLTTTTTTPTTVKQKELEVILSKHVDTDKAKDILQSVESAKVTKQNCVLKQRFKQDDHDLTI